MGYMENYYKERKKEIIIRALEKRGFVREPSIEECYVNVVTGVNFLFRKNGLVDIFSTKSGVDRFTITCTFDQLNYRVDAVEHNSMNECYLEIEYSRENRIRPIPSWYK